jgi:hypothetical protein
MKRKSLPVGILALALVIALGSIGVVYGAWTSTLTATATVNTASVNVYFAPGETFFEVITGGQTCTLAGEGTNALSITINNAYPGHACGLVATIQNDSVFPVTIDKPAFDNHGNSWMDIPTGTFGLAPYTVPAGGKLQGKNIVVLLDDNTPQNNVGATGTFSLLVTQQ